jgi:hypothetical protein
MPALSDLMIVNTKSDAPLNANAPGDANTSAQVSNFVTVQSLGTFAIAVPVLKTIWELIRALAGSGPSWTKSFWTPFVICLVYGFWQLLISISGPNRPTGVMAKLSAAIVAAANAAILAAAVIGLTETTNT